MKKRNILPKINFFLEFVIVASLSVLSSCIKNTLSIPAIKTFYITMNAINVVPTIMDRLETGIAILTLNPDNTLEWFIQVNDLSVQDALTTASVNMGNPVTRGAVLINLVDNKSLKFVGGFANGTRKLSADQMIKMTAGEIYVTVNSIQQPEGLIRGQLGIRIIWAVNVKLSPENEIPSITDRNDRGIAMLRFTDDSMLYSNVQLMNMLSTDTLLTANIEEGGSGEPGGSMVLLAKLNSDLGVSKKIPLMPSVMMHLMSDAHHVNIHSRLKPVGLMCGQLK